MTKRIESAEQGDAFVKRIEENKQSLYKIARSFFSDDADVADAIGQTVLDAWEKLNELKKPAYFKTWLIRILINNCKDICRSRQRLVVTDELPDRPTEEPDPGNLDFSALISALDEGSRTAFVLYYAEGYRVREIAELLDIPPGTVSARLKRGREKLAAIAKGEVL